MYIFLEILFNQISNEFECDFTQHGQTHGLRTPNEGTNQRYLKVWADVADKICFGRT